MFQLYMVLQVTDIIETYEAREIPLSEANPKLINEKKSVPDDINSKEPTKFIAAKLDCTAAGLELEDKVIASTETTSVVESEGRTGEVEEGYLEDSDVEWNKGSRVHNTF